MSKKQLKIFVGNEESLWRKAIETTGFENQYIVEYINEFDPQFYSQPDFQEAFISWGLFDEWCSVESEYFGFSVSSFAKQVHCFDYLEKKAGQLHGRNFVSQSFRETLVQNYSKIDNRKPAFFIGHGPFLRSTCAALIQMGYSRFYVCSDDLQKAEQDIQWLQKSFFGLDFSVLPLEDVTRLKDSASIVVNALHGEVKKQMNADLSYFNYLHLSGAVFDLYKDSDEGFFFEEAQRAGLIVINSQSLFENILKNMTRV